MNYQRCVGIYILLAAYTSIGQLCSGFIPVDDDPTYRLSLNGQWRFLLGSCPADVEQIQFDDSQYPLIDVPSNWEMQGFEAPQYEFPREGTAVYRKRFFIPNQYQHRRIWIRFEGVAFGFELWVNGQFIGQHNSTFTRSEFDITQVVRCGSENLVVVKIDRRRRGWNFDCHDDWALSGIYRDVIVFSVPQQNISDYTVTSRLRTDGVATVQIQAVIISSLAAIQQADLFMQLLSPTGTAVAQSQKTISAGQKSVIADHIFEVASPELWSAEKPSLYTLRIQLKNPDGSSHSVRQNIGIRQVCVVGDVLEINSVPVKLKGVNHHDLHYEVGRAMRREHFLNDIKLMKKANINTVRTSHYPANPVFIELCDQMGLYVISEVSFGKRQNHLQDPDYLQDLYQRAEAAVMRDKNNPSVIIWGVGNEVPVYPNVAKTAAYVKKLDPSRPVILPGAGKHGGTWDIELPDCVDMVSPHYPYAYPVVGRQGWSLQQAAESPSLKRPVLCTEYNHSLEGAFEGLKSRWEMIMAHPRLAGGCIWHFQDQGLKRSVIPGQPVLTDSTQRLKPDKTGNSICADLWLNDSTVIDSFGAYGTDGIVYADRFPQVDYWLTRKVYSPILIPQNTAKISTPVRIPVVNRYDFTNLNEIDGSWILFQDGRPIQKGALEINLPPHQQGQLHIPLDIQQISDSSIYWLLLKFNDNEGYVFYEHTLKCSPNSMFELLAQRLKTPSYSEFSITEQNNQITLQNKYIKINLSSLDGRLAVYSINSDDNPSPKRLLEGPYIDVGRKPELVELMRMSPHTKAVNALSFLEKPQVKEFSIIQCHPQNAVICAALHYPIPGLDTLPEPYFLLKYTLTISTRDVLLDYELSAYHLGCEILEAGIAFEADNQMQQLYWLGQGPYASYPGQTEANDFGIWHIQPLDKTNPQSRYYPGNREGVYMAAICDSNKQGIGFLFQGATICLDTINNRVFISKLDQVAGKGNKTGDQKTLYPVIADHIANIHEQFQITLLPSQGWPDPFAILLNSDQKNDNQ